MGLPGCICRTSPQGDGTEEWDPSEVSGPKDASSLGGLIE